MRYCEWGTSCWQSAAGGERFCYYHQKLAAGLIAGPAKKPATIVSPAQVVSDEQVQIARVLFSMGADKKTVLRALHKEKRRKEAAAT